jgi:DNA-binding NtrC family response regulator
MEEQSTVQRVDAPLPAGQHPREPHLFLVMECARPLSGGARFSLSDVDEVTIGRAPERRVTWSRRKLTLGVPDAMMSSSHAQLVRAGGWVVKDTGSRNGTLVDGTAVESAFVKDDMLLELGGTMFCLRNLPTPPQTAREVQLAPGDGTSPGMATLLPEYAQELAELRRVMASLVPILLLGDTGTGKELLARAAHEVSGRPGPLVPVNCGAIPETLVESQLFGHVRGAFSGAVRDEPGLVRSSDRGTLLLDEVGDLPPASQAALLRVLQEKEVQSIGATRPVKVDLRVVSATHRPIDALTESGFRPDLYARLAGYVHKLPPLASRREDLGTIVGTILRELSAERADDLRIDPALGRTLYEYPWPRNVRELRNALTTALVLATDGKIEPRHVPPEVRDSTAPRGAPPRAASRAPVDGPDAALRDSLVTALTKHRGNVSEVARETGKTRMQIHRWMRRFAIDPEAYRQKP